MLQINKQGYTFVCLLLTQCGSHGGARACFCNLLNHVSAVQCCGTETHSAISGITRNQGNVVPGVFIVVLW